LTELFKQQEGGHFRRWFYLLWPPYVIGKAIIFLPCGFFLLLSFFLFFLA